MKNKITISLIDDHRALTDAMASLLNQNDNFQVVDIAHNHEDAIKLIGQNKTEVYIIDMNLGRGDSCELVSAVKANSKLPIVLSAYSDIALVKKAVKAGAMAYLSKSSAASHISAAIENVSRGKKYFDDIIQSSINASAGVDSKIMTAKERAMLSQLTPREKEIMNLISQEYTSEEIAKELHLSKHTVDGYRKSLINKLRVRGSVGMSKMIN